MRPVLLSLLAGGLITALTLTLVDTLSSPCPSRPIPSCAGGTP